MVFYAPVRGLVGTVGAAVALAAFPGSAAIAREQAPVQRQAKPNVLLIETDDQTVESLRVMANVRRLLIEQGTTFTNSFATYAVCCPSRATAITGQYAHNHGVLGNQPPEGGYYKLDSTNTLPVSCGSSAPGTTRRTSAST